MALPTAFWFLKEPISRLKSAPCNSNLYESVHFLATHKLEFVMKIRLIMAKCTTDWMSLEKMPVHGTGVEPLRFQNAITWRMRIRSKGLYDDCTSCKFIGEFFNKYQPVGPASERSAVAIVSLFTDGNVAFHFNQRPQPDYLRIITPCCK